MGMESVSKRTYVVHSRAWYAERAKLGRDVSEAIHILYEKGNRCWAFHLRLRKFERGRSLFRAEIYADAWTAFADVPELFRALADRGTDADVGEIEATLHELGFKDVTQTEDPDAGDRS